jgi:hypothetical protein
MNPDLEKIPTEKEPTEKELTEYYDKIDIISNPPQNGVISVSYTHLRAHGTG